VLEGLALAAVRQLRPQAATEFVGRRLEELPIQAPQLGQD